MTRPFDRGERMTVSTVIRLAPQDKTMLRAAAKAEGMNTSTFVRRTLANAGVFPIAYDSHEG